MPDYKDLRWEGKLEKILYREKRKPEDAMYHIIFPDDTIEVTRIEIALKRGGHYCTEILWHVPDLFVGKDVILKESLTTEKGLKTIYQELQTEGVVPIRTMVKYQH